MASMPRSQGRGVGMYRWTGVLPQPTSQWCQPFRHTLCARNPLSQLVSAMALMLPDIALVWPALCSTCMSFSVTKWMCADVGHSLSPTLHKPTKMMRLNTGAATLLGGVLVVMRNDRAT